MRGYWSKPMVLTSRLEVAQRLPPMLNSSTSISLDAWVNLYLRLSNKSIQIFWRCSRNDIPREDSYGHHAEFCVKQRRGFEEEQRGYSRHRSFLLFLERRKLCLCPRASLPHCPRKVQLRSHRRPSSWSKRSFVSIYAA